MKKVFLGLFAGAALCAGAFIIMIPKMKQAAYDNGYAIGNKDGIAAGTTAGITKGISEEDAKMQAERQKAAEAAKEREARMRIAAKPKKVEKEIQNWHVIDGKIGDPIVD